MENKNTQSEAEKAAAAKAKASHEVVAHPRVMSEADAAKAKADKAAADGHKAPAQPAPVDGPKGLPVAEYNERVARVRKEAAELGMPVSGQPGEGVTSEGVVLKQGSPYLTREEFQHLDGLLPEEREANRVAQLDADNKMQTRLDAQAGGTSGAGRLAPATLTPAQLEQNRKDVAAGRKPTYNSDGNLNR